MWLGHPAPELLSHHGLKWSLHLQEQSTLQCWEAMLEESTGRSRLLDEILWSALSLGLRDTEGSDGAPTRNAFLGWFALPRDAVFRPWVPRAVGWSCPRTLSGRLGFAAVAWPRQGTVCLFGTVGGMALVQALSAGCWPRALVLPQRLSVGESRGGEELQALTPG